MYGVSLVSAIFLLVVLSLLAAAGVRMMVLQQQTTTMELRSTQAFHAARTGLNWAAHRSLSADWCSNQTLALSEAGTQGFFVDVSCTRSTHVEGGTTISVYTIVALAQSGLYGGPDYVSRRMQAKVTNG